MSGKDGFRAKESPQEIYPYNQIPATGRRLDEWAGGRYCRIVDQDIYLAPLIQHPSDHGLDLFLHQDISLNSQGYAACGFNLHRWYQEWSRINRT